MAGEILPPVESGGFLKPKDHIGHLMIVTEVHSAVTRYDEVRKTDTEVLTVDSHCFNCNGAAAPERLLWGSPYMVSKVRRDGNLTLGYIGELPPKPGYKDGAIILTEPRPEDIPRAVAWWDSVKAMAIQGPATPAADPYAPPTQAADPWAVGPVAAPAPAAQAAPWGAAPAAAPAPAPTPPPAPAPAVAQAGPSFDQVQAMPLVAVQALVSQGVITADQARQAGHTV